MAAQAQSQVPSQVTQVQVPPEVTQGPHDAQVGARAQVQAPSQGSRAQLQTRLRYSKHYGVQGQQSAGPGMHPISGKLAPGSDADGGQGSEGFRLGLDPPGCTPRCTSPTLGKGLGADLGTQEVEGTGDQEVQEGPQSKFDPSKCGNLGQPLVLEWQGQYSPIADGFGLCSPTRWLPSNRGVMLDQTAQGFAKAMHQVLRQFVDDTIRDPQQTVCALAVGRFKQSPFTKEDLDRLRQSWFGCIEVAMGAKQQALGSVPESQPFYLHALALTARLLQDPDWGVIESVQDSYATGVSLGYDEPAPHIPQVYEPKGKSRKLDESEEEWLRQNYESANQSSDQLENKFREEEQLNRMFPSTLPVLRERFGHDRVRVASLGAIMKDDGTARPLHDATHGVHVNNHIRLLNQQANPGPSEVVHMVRAAQESKEACFALTGDVSSAHRLVRIREADWGLLACRVKDDSPVVWVNKVATFGLTSSSFLWSRLFGIIGRCVARFLLQALFWHMCYVDDLHANFGGKRKFTLLLMWLAMFEVMGTPFSYKKFKGGYTVAFVGYELSYADTSVGISSARGGWILRWIEDARKARFVVQVRRFSEFLGRLGFVARLLTWIKPHLGPLYSWQAAVTASTVAKLPDTVIFTLEYLRRAFSDMSFKVPATRALKGGGVAFRTDAKCADGFVVVGGWETTQAPSAARWFSLRITPEDAPYLFDSAGKSQWASASAELLGTLVALWAFGHFKKSTCRRSLVVELRAETDNRGNEALLAKKSTTRWPLLFLNMQLSELLMRASLRLALGWRPRDENQQADDLTNEVYDSFDPKMRVSFAYQDLPLQLLHELVETRNQFEAARNAQAVLHQSVGRPRFGGKRKKEDKDPW